MKGINDYWQRLSEEDIAAGKHRDFVGGIWDDIGRLQLEFLKQNRDCSPGTNWWTSVAAR